MPLTATTAQDSQLLAALIQMDDIDQISQQLLGRSYVTNCLGEGVDGQFDQQPLYRLDCFDCVTYVNTVIALARSRSLNEFKKNIVSLNYRDSEIKYENRHHFMSVDWNIYNQQAGLFSDVTEHMLPSSIAYAECNIDKPAWYQAKKLADIKLPACISPKERADLLVSLQAISNQVVAEHSRLAYIPIQQLFSTDCSQAFYKAMPSISIVEIVRPEWDLRASIGTHLNISHVGLAIKTEQGIQFRHATILASKVVECNLLDYLAAYKQHPTVKGIHVLAYLG